MTGVHSYDILLDPEFQNLLNYKPIIDCKEGTDNSEKCFQNELVRLILSLPYMSIANRQRFKFDAHEIYEPLEDFIQPMDVDDEPEIPVP